jgi:hypothetical protein
MSNNKTSDLNANISVVKLTQTELNSVAGGIQAPYRDRYDGRLPFTYYSQNPYRY